MYLRVTLLWKIPPPMEALLVATGASSRLAYPRALLSSSSFAEGGFHRPRRRRQHRRRRRRWGESFYSSYAPTSGGDDIIGMDAHDLPPKVVNVPLVFVPGMKGTHLAFADDGSVGTTSKKERVWLTLGNLLNIPPRPDDDPSRDLSLPLTYDRDPPDEGDEDVHAYASHYPRQHRGKLVPDGIVEHIIEFGVGGRDDKTTGNFVDMNFLPFYGHVVSSRAAIIAVSAEIRSRRFVPPHPPS
jgi:hypothetical protein